MRRAVLPILAALLFSLPGCAAGPDEVDAISPGTPGYVLLPGLNPLPQGSHAPTDCGPETVCAALKFLGKPVPIAEAENEIYIPSIKGSTTPGIVAFARRKGATATVTERGGLWKLEEHLKAGSPVIIEVTRGGQYHYFFVTGLSRQERVVVCAYYGNRQHKLSFEMLDELWKPTRYRSITFAVTAIEKLLEEGFDFLDGGRYAQAEERFQKALQAQPECGPALAGMGRARIEQGKPEEARDFLERALKTMPTDPEVLNNLAHVILALKGDAARALGLARSAVENQLKQIREFEEELAVAPPGTRERVEVDLKKARERTFYYYGTLGQALEATGALKASIDARLESLKYPHLADDDPDAPARRHLEIALACRALGVADRSEEHFRKALESAKSEAMKEKIRRESGK